MENSPSSCLPSDQRLRRRFPVRCHVAYRTELGQEAQAIVEDLSENGLRLIVSEPLALREKIYLRLPPDTQSGREALVTVGKVVWQTRKNGKGKDRASFSTGLQLIDKEMRQQRLFRELMKAPESTAEQSTKRWKAPYQKFVYEKPVFLKHTNLEGNTYYDNYVSWQGEAREACLLSHPHIKEVLQQNQHIRMVTHSAVQRFISESTFGDVVRIELTTRDLKTCSLVLVFRFYKKENNVLLGEGWQRICFMNLQTGRLTRVPDYILDFAESMRESSDISLRIPC